MPRRPAAPSVFHAVADPTRRDLLRLLLAGEQTAGELAQPFGISQPALSQHLRVLRHAGLVRHRTAGRHRVYALDPAPLREVADWVGFFDRFWDRRLEALGQFLDRRHAR